MLCTSEGGITVLFILFDTLASIALNQLPIITFEPVVALLFAGFDAVFVVTLEEPFLGPACIFLKVQTVFSAFGDACFLVTGVLSPLEDF